jgi:hypothetical protein
MGLGQYNRQGVGSLVLTWRERAEPLLPSATLALGAVARTLLVRLLQNDDQQLKKLSGVAGPGIALVLGAAIDLPWVDGVQYLGKDADAPTLLLPTAWAPQVPVRWLEGAVTRKVKQERGSNSAGLLAVSREPPLLVPASAALHLTRAQLEHALNSSGTEMK